MQFYAKKKKRIMIKKKQKKITNTSKQNFIYLLIFICPVSVYKLNLHK